MWSHFKHMSALMNCFAKCLQLCLRNVCSITMTYGNVTWHYNRVASVWQHRLWYEIYTESVAWLQASLVLPCLEHCQLPPFSAALLCQLQLTYHWTLWLSMANDNAKWNANEQMICIKTLCLLWCTNIIFKRGCLWQIAE